MTHVSTTCHDRFSWGRWLPLCLLATLLAITPALAQDAKPNWQVVATPASINRDKTIKLLAGQTQLVDLMFLASDVVQAKPGPYPVELELDLPKDIKLVQVTAGWAIDERQDLAHDNASRQRVRLKMAVPKARLAGKPGQRPQSEWRTMSVFLEPAPEASPSSLYIVATLTDGDDTARTRWPVTVTPLEPRTQPRPKLTTIGFWDYAYHRAKDAAPGVARLFEDAGVNFTQKSSQAMAELGPKHGITVGGDVHHDYFYGGVKDGVDLRDIDVQGKPMSGFASATRTLALPEDAPIAGVSKIVEFARAQHGIATYDYEPMNGSGFTPEAIALFKKQYDVSDADFDAFHEQFKKHRRSIYVNGDDLGKEIHRRWVRFHTQQAAAYVKRITDAAKAIDPNIRIAMTPNAPYEDDSLAALGYGYNAARFAPHVDIIMPQIYIGYGGAAAKLTGQFVQGWRQSMEQYGAKSELWPILLVRYAGASPFNSPQRIRQQIISALAHGAHGFLLYYPSNMDAPYWQTLARTTDEISQYETYYHRGQRVDEQYELIDMVQGSVEVGRYPAHKIEVENPQWDFTAHRHEGKTLLTLWNLEDSNDVLFTVKLPQGAKVVQAVGVESYGEGKWLVAPSDIAYVIVE